MRYKLLIKQTVQIVGYIDDDGVKENIEPQMIMVMFASDNKTEIGNAAKLLHGMNSKAQITIYDSVSGNKITVQ